MAYCAAVFLGNFLLTQRNGHCVTLAEQAQGITRALQCAVPWRSRKQSLKPAHSSVIASHPPIYSWGQFTRNAVFWCIVFAIKVSKHITLLLACCTASSRYLNPN